MPTRLVRDLTAPVPLAELAQRYEAGASLDDLVAIVTAAGGSCSTQGLSNHLRRAGVRIRPRSSGGGTNSGKFTRDGSRGET